MKKLLLSLTFVLSLTSCTKYTKETAVENDKSKQKNIIPTTINPEKVKVPIYG